MSLLGYNGLVEQPPRREYNPKQGWTTFKVYHGSTEAVEGAIPAMVASGLTFSETVVQDGIREIEIQYSNAQDGAAPATNPDTEQTVTWELAGNDLQKDIFHHPDFDLLAEADQVIMRDFRNGVVNIDAAGLDDGLLDATGKAFRDVINKGEESYLISQYVLRRVGVVSLDWQGTFGITNVGKYYSSSSDLTDVEGVPSALKFSLPSGEWLKRTPTVKQGRDGRWSMTQEWWHADDWSDLFYDAVVV